MNPTPDLASMVPGFEFLQNLMKSAGSAIPGMGQWVAPTLDPAEIDKRIQELRTVQYWLEQNARLLSTTIQALEVQRMTLSTLQSMNLPLADVRDALMIKTPFTSAFAPAVKARNDPGPDAPDAPDAPSKRAASAPASPATDSAAADPPAAPPAVDPLQWWNALTQQFTQIASEAVKQGAAAVGKARPSTTRAAAASRKTRPRSTTPQKKPPRKRSP